jgi:hypothetical protein
VKYSVAENAALQVGTIHNFILKLLFVIIIETEARVEKG